MHARALPEGSNWYCFSLGSGDVGEIGSFCQRTLAKCEQHRTDTGAALKKRLDEGDPADLLSRCTKQKRTAVFTAKDLRNEAYFFLAHSGMGECKGQRLRFVESEDFETVSRCSWVGTVVASPPERVRIPPGRGWYCWVIVAPDETIFDHCVRDRQACEAELSKLHTGSESIVSACDPKPAAYVFTTNNDAFATSTMKQCERVRLESEIRSTCRRIE